MNKSRDTYLWDPLRFLWADLRHHQFAKEREREREPGKIAFSESYYLLLFPRFTIDDCFYLCLLSLEWLR